MPQDDDFLRSLRATFKVEAAEHVGAIAQGLLALERTAEAGERRQLVETIFRAAHSLKGAARAVNLAEVETICQRMEDIFALWRRQEGAPEASTLDALHRSLDQITRAVEGPADAPATP